MRRRPIVAAVLGALPVLLALACSPKPGEPTSSPVTPGAPVILISIDKIGRAHV